MIDINLYGIAKQQAGTTTNSQVMFNTGGETTIQPHYIWGQLFNGFDDIDGDMKVNGTAYIDYLKTLKINSNIGYFTYLNSSYANIDYLNTIKVKGSKAEFDFASILKAFIGEMSSKSITTENLTVTKSLHAFEMIIDQIKASGGAVIFTPANGFTVRQYEKIEGGWRLYFLAQERGEKITNMWKINDQAICQNFNRAGQGVNYNVSNKYYWSLVINTNNDDSNNGNAVVVNVGTVENVDMQPCHYIDISDTTFDGTIDIDKDDEIAMLGYRGEDDEARQNAIYISSYASLDTDLKAPLIVQYKRINDFNLSSHKYTWFSGGVTPQGEANGYRANEIRGSFKVSDGTSLEDFINQQTQIKTYRIVASPTELVRDYEGNLSHSRISVTVLETLQGQVTETTTVPEGTKLIVSSIKNTVIETIETKTVGDGLAITVTDSMKDLDYLELKLVSSDDTQRLDTQRIGITDVDNSNTKIDRIVDTGTVTLMNYDIENEAYSLQYQIKMLIYHYDGGSFTSVTTSTTPSASDYTIRCALVKTDQTETNVETYQADTVFYATPEYRVTSESITWDRATANYVYLKISLIKDSETVDNLIIPITLTPTASLDIIQGETAKIVATITGANEDWYNGYTYLSNYISQVRLTAEENASYIGRITSYIDDLTGQIGEKASWSYIIQHADEINMSVIDGLKNTGIDITSGEIKLNADNTTIIGNLNITDTQNGITVFGTVEHNEEEVKVPKINLQPKAISDISTLEDGHLLFPSSVFNGSQKSGASESTTNYKKTFESNNITLERYGVIDITNFYLTCYRYLNTNILTVSAPTIYVKVKYGDNIYNVDTITTTSTGVQYQFKDYNKKRARFTALEAGSYKIILEVISTTSYNINYPDFSVGVGCNIYVSKALQTYIGVDGMYSQAGSMNLLYSSNEEIRLQHGFNGIRWKKGEEDGYRGNRGMEVLASIYTNMSDNNQSLSLWMPFYNYTPLTKLDTQSWTQMNIYTPNSETKFVYVIDPTKLNGIIVVNYLPLRDLYSFEYADEAWIQLPRTDWRDENNNICTLPSGYTVTIINQSNRRIYVTPYRGASNWNGDVIIDANMNENNYVGMHDNMTTRDTFIYVENYNGAKWISMHDH